MDIGVAHLRKSKKVRFPLKAINIPIGFPITVALLPMFVAKINISVSGIGFTL